MLSATLAKTGLGIDARNTVCRKRYVAMEFNSSHNSTPDLDGKDIKLQRVYSRVNANRDITAVR